MTGNITPVYIVTGAAGHLGSTITKMLNDQGKTVYALCLPDEKHMPHGANVTVFTGDIRHKDSLAEMFDSCGSSPVTVIHCAGIVSIASKFEQRVYDVNVTGVKNIVELCERYQVKMLVYIGSVHAIPVLPDNGIMSETDRFNPDAVVGLYAKTKAEASQYVIEYAARGNGACIILPSGLIGPGDYGRGHLTQLVVDFYKGGLTSGVEGGYDIVDVRDVAQGILSCCENGGRGECDIRQRVYILSGQYYTVQELLQMLHEVTGKKKVKRILPVWFAKVTAPLSEIYYRILKQPPLFTSYSILTLNSNANFSHERAARELGYTVRPLKETLADTVSWLKDIGRIE